MKVIVQDVETGAYLSANGQWVRIKAEARDFLTLLRAYHFAKDNTARRFQVLLHCADDQYCAPILTGVGTAAGRGETRIAPIKAKVALPVSQKICRPKKLWSHANRFDLSRNDLN